MINRLIWLETDNTYPYRNLAMEEYMTNHVPDGTCILFLWQNRHTVVIGRRQCVRGRICCVWRGCGCKDKGIRGDIQLHAVSFPGTWTKD